MMNMEINNFNYKKFYEMYFEQPDDPAPEVLAEVFNISLNDVHAVGGLLTLLESIKGVEPLDARAVKLLIDSNIITSQELSQELGITELYIQQLCNQAV